MSIYLLGDTCCRTSAFTDSDSLMCCGSSVVSQHINTMCCGGMVVSAVDRVCCNGVVHDVIPGYVCCDTSYEADNTTLCCTARNGVERVIIVFFFNTDTCSYTFIFVRQSLTQAQKTSQLLMRNAVTSHQFPPSFPVVTTELTIHSWRHVLTNQPLKALIAVLVSHVQIHRLAQPIVTDAISHFLLTPAIQLTLLVQRHKLVMKQHQFSPDLRFHIM